VIAADQPTDASVKVCPPFAPRGGRSGSDTDAWMQAIRPRLVALARRFVWNVHDAEELAQEALMRFWQHQGELSEIGVRGAWIYRTTINLCITRLRRKRVQLGLVEDRADSQSGPVQESAISELAQRVRDVISELPEPLRVALVLRELEGLNYKQIAAIVQARPVTLRLRVYRAREAVRNTLLQRWPDSFGK
jgi:RNA polymerase sigma-70 factor, ECF subfamily